MEQWESYKRSLITQQVGQRGVKAYLNINSFKWNISVNSTKEAREFVGRRARLSERSLGMKEKAHLL